MNNCFPESITSKAKLLISLLLMMLLVISSGFSCQSSGPATPMPTPTTTPQPTNVEVVIEGFTFKPAMLTVSVGTTVIWQNKDSVPHTVTARDGTVDSGNMSTGDIFSYTFEEKGIFEYYCTIHPYMEGTVIVE